MEFTKINKENLEEFSSKEVDYWLNLDALIRKKKNFYGMTFLLIIVSILLKDPKPILVLFLIYYALYRSFFGGFYINYITENLLNENNKINDFLKQNYDIFINKNNELKVDINDDINLSNLKKGLGSGPSRKIDAFLYSYKNNDFEIKNNLYLSSYKGSISDNYISSKIEFNKNIKVDSNITNNSIDGVFENSKEILKFILYFFGVILLIISFINQIYQDNKVFNYILNNFKIEYLYYILVISIILGLIFYKINHLKTLKKRTEIYNNEIEKKFDLFDCGEEKLSEDYLNKLYNFTQKEENKDKSYSFYVKDNSLSIKLDLIKSYKKFNVVDFNVVDYVLEFRDHILLAKELSGFYR